MDEARDVLNPEQYDYLARQVRELARNDDPTHSSRLDIRAIGEFFELREKGGVLNKINARVFFAVKNMVDRIKTFSREDRMDFLSLLLQVQETGDPEEHESLVRAIEEIWEQRPIVAESFPLDEQPMSEGLTKWTSHVANRIKELREEAGISIAALAEAADVPPEYVGLIEQAQESASNLALSKIAAALRVDVGEIDPIAD
jgi:DNA-binding XRE family transcriptional regulator